MNDVVKILTEMSGPPSQAEAFDTWLKMGSALEFLRDNAAQREFVVYASGRSIFVHAILAPVSVMSPPDINDLMSWNCTPTSSWGVTVQFSEPASVWISPSIGPSGVAHVDSIPAPKRIL